MTDLERETMEALIKYHSMKVAAQELGIALNTLSQRVLRIKLKAEKYRLWLREFERYALQLPPKYVG